MSTIASSNALMKDVFAAAPALLGRNSTIAYGTAARNLMRGKSVLVTGAGGSIGSEIVRQVRSLDAEHVYLLDQDEGALHALQLEISGNGLLTDPHVILADIRDPDTIHRLMQDIRPDVVFHAAAHKHLPLLERFPAEGVKANVAGTHNVVAAAESAGTRLIVNVSTDKAAEPTSVLGATKRIAEDIAACYAGDRTRVASVRFGNVLGSRGSLLTSLNWQVHNGQPVTVTDPRATRYFMTIPEAASLVIEAAVLADRGETYVLDMGDPVAITDLIGRFLDLLGADNPIVYTGLRDGGEARRAARRRHLRAHLVHSTPPDLTHPPGPGRRGEVRRPGTAAVRRRGRHVPRRADRPPLAAGHSRHHRPRRPPVTGNGARVMNLYSALGWVLTLFLVPLAWVLIDAIGGVRARHSAANNVGTYSVSDFAVLVPIYGSIRYLENADYLATYGSKVILCTTTHESDEFNQALDGLARRHGFRIFRAHVDRPVSGAKRATGGTVRDTVIRDVLPTVTEEYVVCLDADTTTTQPLDILIGAMCARGLEIASIRLVPSNATHSIMTRLQTYEYRLAMKMRIIAPWLVSGACHAGRSDALGEVMGHHSLFFQGNDVETGVIAEAMGYRVGHVPFEVPTTVPETVRAWWRQHLAWAGGEFRLFVINARVGLRHPFFWGYGLIVTIVMLPLRWHAVIHADYVLATVLVLYVALGLYLHRAGRDLALLLVPFYAAFISLVLVPLGALSYVTMAINARNAGVIRAPRRASNEAERTSMTVSMRSRQAIDR